MEPFIVKGLREVNIVMTNCTIVSQKNVALHATIVSYVTIAAP